MKHWLVKQEPEDYAWARLLEDGWVAWTGVRNFQARNFMRSMGCGDLVVYYHSGEEKRAVGVARVRREAYSDPTAAGGDWSCVDLEPVRGLVRSVELAAIRADAVLRETLLVRQTRLSVLPLSPEQFARLLELGETPLPRGRR